MNTANYVVLSLSLLALSVNSFPFNVDDLQPFDTDQEECLWELNLNRIDIGLISADLYPVETDDHFNEFMSCTWKKQGFQFPNGQINYKTVEDFFGEFLKYQANGSQELIKLSDKMARIATESCRNIKGVSHGQTVVKVQNCMFRKLYKLSLQYRHL